MELPSLSPAVPGGGPLAGVRILSVEQVVALPYATQLLARLGADVVKIEHPVDGDTARHSNPALRDEDGRLVGGAYIRSNLEKRSVGLDLKADDGRDLFLALAKNFHVVADNLRAGTMERLGLGPHQLLERFPGIVYVSISGFGSDPRSPYYSWPAYAPTVEAMGGFGEAVREPDQPPPVGTAGALGDIGASLFACVGMLAALRQVDRTGRGQHVDIAMFDAMVAMADSVPFTWSMLEGRTAGPGGSTTVAGPFRASDGYFILFAREAQFRVLAGLVGHDEWVDDPEWAVPGAWKARVESHIRPAVENWAGTRTRLEACHALCGLGIAAGPSNGAQDLVTDPHVQAHRMLVEVPRPDSDRPLLVAGNPIKLSDEPTEQAPPSWPLLGEHTFDVLASEVNLSLEDLEDLASRGVITAPVARANRPKKPK